MLIYYCKKYNSNNISEFELAGYNGIQQQKANQEL